MALKYRPHEDMTYKYCACCDTVKHVSEFNRNRSKNDGCQTYCRECNRAGNPHVSPKLGEAAARNRHNQRMG